MARGDDRFSLYREDMEPEVIEAMLETAGYPIAECLIDALPHESYDPRAWRVEPARPTRIVDEGDVVSIGNRHFEVLHLPGHSPGSVGLWEAATGTSVLRRRGLRRPPARHAAGVRRGELLPHHGAADDAPGHRRPCGARAELRPGAARRAVPDLPGGAIGKVAGRSGAPGWNASPVAASAPYPRRGEVRTCRSSIRAVRRARLPAPGGRERSVRPRRVFDRAVRPRRRGNRPETRVSRAAAPG